MLIDSHAHIDMLEFDRDREEMLSRARQKGVNAIVTIGTDLKSSRKSIELAQSHPDIFTSVGFHPHDAAAVNDESLKELKELAQQPKIVAIGEIGLDFYRNYAPRPRQLEAFQKQLEMAYELHFPVIIHSRNAQKETWDILSQWVNSTDNGRHRGVIHCFSGDIDLANRYIDMGFFISLAGPVTYPGATEKTRIAREIRLDKLLVETDCPFLTPLPYRGQRNEPSYVALTVERIATIREMKQEYIAEMTAQNAVELFHLTGF